VLQATALIVSVAALALAAASLWHAALKPAEILLEHIPERTIRIAGGGISGVPAIFRLHLPCELTNLGARAGVLESIELGDLESVGQPNFAAAAVPPLDRTGFGAGLVVEVGSGPVDLPRTIEAGDVRSYQLNVELDGPFRSATYTTPTPDLEPIARLLADLVSVEFDVICNYRRRSMLGTRRRSARHVEHISISGVDFRQNAVEYWDDPQDGANPRLGALARGDAA
jgi:hypothetical protein